MRTPHLLALLFTLLLLVPTLGCDDPPEPAPHTDPVAHVAAVDTTVRTLDALFSDYPALAPWTPPDEADVDAWVAETLEGMTLDQKIGQLFIVHLPTGTGLRRLLREDRALAAVRQHHVGGFLVSRLMPPEDVRDAVSRLQQSAAVPLFFAADYERGVGRFSNNLTELPSNMALGATRDTLLAAAAGRLTALEARATGINLLFAPVADVNNNPDNPIINIRSFGEDPAMVGRMVTAYVRAAEAEGVLTTVKHFPGHGNTAVDSHSSMGTVPGDQATLAEVELRPFAEVFASSQPPAAVMTAHLWVRAFDPVPTPATFSREILRTHLRDHLGFEGLVITDDVKMGALHESFSLTERVVRPLEAGADIILTPDNLAAATEAIRVALKEQRLSEGRLEASVRRVLRAKARAGLHRQAVPEAAPLARLLAAPYGEPIAQAAADQALTLLDTTATLPLQPSQRVALVQLTNYEGSQTIAAAMDVFAATLDTSGYAVRARYEADPEAREADRLVGQVRDGADVLVVALYLRLQSGRGEAGLFEEQARLVRRLMALDVPTVIVTFGNPYAVETFPDAEAYVVGYDQALASIRTAVRIMQGTWGAQGRLPVTVGRYAYGSGRVSPVDRVPGP